MPALPRTGDSGCGGRRLPRLRVAALVSRPHRGDRAVQPTGAARRGVAGSRSIAPRSDDTPEPGRPPGFAASPARRPTPAARAIDAFGPAPRRPGRARLPLRSWSSSRGEAGETTGPSRKVRTPQGTVVGEPTRGNPRESAPETHRPSGGSHVNSPPARLK